MTKINKKKGRPAIPDATKKLIIEAYLRDDMTCEQIASAFHISSRTVFRIMAAQREVPA